MTTTRDRQVLCEMCGNALSADDLPNDVICSERGTPCSDVLTCPWLRLLARVMDRIELQADCHTLATQDAVDVSLPDGRVVRVSLDD